MPCLRREARARLDEARRSPRGSRPRGPSRRARARPARARRARRPPGRAPRRRRRRASGTTASGRSRRIGSSIRRCSARAALGVGDEVRREARAARGAGSRATIEHAVRRVLALLDRRAERVELRQPAARRRTARAAARARSGRRSAAREPGRSSSSPSPVARRDLRARPGSGSRAAGGRAGRRRSILFSTSSTRQLAGADLVQHLIDRRDRSSSPLVVGRDASTTCSTRSATSVSSSVDANPSTSWCGSRRMKPTVSVTR